MRYLVIPLLFTLANANAQIVRQWAASFNGSGDFNDRFTCIVRDAAGNFLVGGSTVNPDADRDFLVQKIAPTGATLWTWHWNGSGGSSDELRALTLDAAGNVLATGISQSDSTGTDFLTVKIGPTGDLFWTKHYDFAGEYDQPNAIASDAAGNVFVTGISDQNPGPLENYDYATVKYSPFGQQLWAERFDGFGSGNDQAVAIGCDAAGNAYVTGRSDNGDNDDMVTLSYSPDGFVRWAKYDDRGDRDRGTALTLDYQGNIVVAGRSDNGDNDDFWILKYASTGNLLWEKTYDYLDQDRPVAMASDAAGNVFLTGQSDKNATAPTDWDFLTLAFAADGSLLWDRRFDSGLNTDDIPAAIGTDGAGAVYVAGVSDTALGNAVANQMLTLKYAVASGQLIWQKNLGTTGNQDQAANALAAFPGGCAVAGFSEKPGGERDALLETYAADGSEMLHHIYNGVGDNNDNLRDLAVDGLGNVFAAGYRVGGGNNRDMVVVQFDANGQPLCRRSLEGTAPGGEDDALAIELDAAGNPIAAGFRKNSDRSNDITLLKINALCDSLWTLDLNGPGGGSDLAYDMAKTPEGDFVVVGRVDSDPSPAANDDCFTAKISADGAMLWSKTYNSGGSRADRGVKVAIAPNGDIVVAGRTWDGAQYDIFCLKYGKNGTQKWLQTFDGGGSDLPTDLALDPSGNALICGRSRQSAGDTLNDFIVLKFKTTGERLWEKRFDGGHDDRADALATDAAGNVAVVGRSRANASLPADYNTVALKFAPDGTLLWNKNLGSPGSDAPDDVATNAQRQIYLTGHFSHPGAQPPVFEIRTFVLDEDGQILWQDQFDGEGSEVPNLLLLDGSDFYVAGSQSTPERQRDMLVLKYTGAVVGTGEVAQKLGFQVFPNPFSQEIFVKTSADRLPENAVFELHDALGRRVFRGNLSSNEERIALPSLPPGVYGYRILAGASLVAFGQVSSFE